MKCLLNSFLEKKLLLALCGGILFSISFLIPELFLSSILGVIFIFLSIYSEQKIEKAFKKGFIFGLGFYIPLYYWFVALYPFEAFNFTMSQGIAIIIIACLGISTYHSIFMGFSLFLLSKFNLNKYCIPFGLAVAFMFNEWIISLGVLSFSWGKVAISQIYALPLLQTSSLFGSYFITFIIVISGAYIGYSIINKFNKFYLFIGLFIYSCNLLVGTVLYFTPDNIDKEITATIIQGNVSTEEKWEDNGNYSVKYYLKKTEELASSSNTDIIVLPESCFPIYMDDNHYVINEIKNIANKYDVNIAFGCIYKSEDGPHNTLYMINSNGEKVGIYSKRHLVPFGEFLPYENVLEKFDFIKELNLGGFSYVQGDNSNILETNNTKFGSLVCFDSIFTELGRDSVINGAQIINVITNDSWYKDTRGVYQHAAFSQLCAIQNKRFVIRSANTGISMFIDSKGNVIDSIPPLVRGEITSTVNAISERTLYSYIGDIFFPIISILYLSIQIVHLIKHRKKVD